MTGKPPYSVPSMADIAAIEPNGFNVVSTFSGCGGSSLGYRMAGFTVLWASEFISAARDTYLANSSVSTVLDGRDIREVTASDLLEGAGIGKGELDIFDGSPPCASFSRAGTREAGWGTVKKYSDTVQRSDDLFFEYARLIDGVQPRTFVAENVSGLLQGTSKGYFKLVLRALRECGYQVRARLLNASWLGVPQARRRVIFVGVRNDLDVVPVFPRPLPYQYTVRDALPWVLEQNKMGFGANAGMRAATVPSPTLGASPNTGNGNFPASRVISRIAHEGYVSAGNFRDISDRTCPTITSGVGGSDSRNVQVQEAAAATTDPETHQRLTVRRFYYGEELVETRRLTLGELRALSGFPADFALTGSYLQRWERIGRAVPPVMMSHIAGAIRDYVLIPLRERGAI